MKHPHKHPRAFGVFLSLFFPGSGHLFMGKERKALLFFGFLGVCHLATFFGRPPIYLVSRVLIFGAVLYAIMDILRSPVFESSNFRNSWWFCLGLVVVCRLTLAAGLLMIAPATAVYKIPSSSMVPSLNIGERILVDQGSYWDNEIERWDIVVFYYPRSPDETWVKRVVGLPGDLVTVTRDRLLINGNPVPLRAADPDLVQPYKDALYSQSPEEQNVDAYIESDGEHEHLIFLSGDQKPSLYRVPPDHYFVMGDNRSFSYDSRGFGPVHVSLILGKVYAIFKPEISLSRFGLYRELGQE